jgi:transposase-like protein
MDRKNRESSTRPPEVRERPTRRHFEAEYKLRILEEADRCIQPGQLGELLRREGLYSSHLNTWRRQRDAGVLQGLRSQKRGRKPKRKDPLALEVERLKDENQRLAERLRQAETIIEVQKKISEMLAVRQPTPTGENN